MQITAEHIGQLKAGVSATQKMVFEGFYNAMFRTCQRYLVRTDEAEDCVMKGFLKAFQQIGSFDYRDENSFHYWLKRIVVNEALMALRKQNNFNLVPHENMPDLAVNDTGIQHIEAAYLFEAVMKLPPGYRTVFNLFVIEGYSHQEIAQMLNITESTSKTQLVKGKEKLKKLITQQHYGYGNS
jgi:RNA polymerase sigma factor (sigma-70 family)